MRKLSLWGLVLSSMTLGQRLEFNVASVRPAAPMSQGEVQGSSGGPGTRDPERINFRRVSLLLLLQRSFDLTADRISGPGWLATEYYDIAAKVPPGATKEQFNAMLQDLLVERFGLAFHYMKKDLVVYSLVIAKGGLKMKESAVDPAAPIAARPPSPDGPGRPRFDLDADGFPILPPGDVPATQGRADPNGIMKISARQTAMSALLRLLQQGLEPGTRVVDKTGLTGKYDFRLQFAARRNAAAPPQETPGVDAADPVPDVSTAVQQQLGLKLEKGSESFDFLVVDHLEKVPSGN